MAHGGGRGIKPQRKLTYDAVCLLLRPYLYLLYRFRLPEKKLRLSDGPVMVLGNHSGNLDFLFALCALWPKRFHPVIAAHFYRNKRLARLFDFFRCIRKEQFRADVLSVAQMRSAAAQGESILIYPEGEVNGTGRTGPGPKSIARLARMLKIPLYAVRTYGSYFTRPKWNPVQRHGRVELEIELIATAQEAAALPLDQLYRRIEEKTFVDDYDWQKTARIPFPMKERALGLDKLLYLCPRCNAEGAMRAGGSAIYCQSCGNRGEMDEYGFLAPSSAHDVIPAAVPDWVELERQALREKIAREDFCLSTPAVLQYHLSTRSTAHTPVGRGIVTLNREELIYEGTAQGESVRLAFPLHDIFKLPFTMGEQFDVPNTLRTLSIRPDDYSMVQKFVLAVPLIHEYNEL